MGSSKQTRDSAQAATEKHPTTGSLPVAETYLSVRLWSSGGPGGPVPIPLECDSPIVSLATDLIAASKGAAVSNRDGFLVTSFHAVLPAVSTARRLQWAVQGLAEGRDFRGTSIAVLIHYVHDLPVETGQSAVRDALEQATPGQILLTEAIGKSFDDLPGFPSQALDNSSLRELLWRAPDSQSTLPFDEQVLTQLLEQQGPQDDLPEEPEWTGTPAALGPIEPDSEAIAPSAGFMSMAKSPLGIGIASAAVLVLAGFFIFHSIQGKSKPAAGDTAPPASSSGTSSSTGTQPVQPSTDTTRTSTSPSTTSSAPPPLTAAEKRKKDREDKEEEKRKAALAKGTTATPTVKPEEDKGGRIAHGCDAEDPGQYARLFEKAKGLYSRGRYDDAARQFDEVARCQPGNAQAREWAEKAKREKEKEN
ncbi:MAG: hypothetical protein ACLPY1_15085 [Terracidiphilus sp.]